jgi:hypothetical protein
MTVHIREKSKDLDMDNDLDMDLIDKTPKAAHGEFNLRRSAIEKGSMMASGIGLRARKSAPPLRYT